MLSKLTTINPNIFSPLALFCSISFANKAKYDCYQGSFFVLNAPTYVLFYIIRPLSEKTFFSGKRESFVLFFSLFWYRVI